MKYSLLTGITEIKKEEGKGGPAKSGTRRIEIYACGSRLLRELGSLGKKDPDEFKRRR